MESASPWDRAQGPRREASDWPKVTWCVHHRTTTPSRSPGFVLAGVTSLFLAGPRGHLVTPSTCPSCQFTRFRKVTRCPRASESEPGGGPAGEQREGASVRVWPGHGCSRGEVLAGGDTGKGAWPCPSPGEGTAVSQRRHHTGLGQKPSCATDWLCDSKLAPPGPSFCFTFTPFHCRGS